eukprot:TRINITY_DN6640_c0_g1_i10.p2 TRINITY_DN6640_c0_g1~~TRINITY_DN6640_c0_g1_i10.p2  ORF type:complete len:125 (+),score=5.18 TRINITY_DN6640_c0_g1_i10:91-465(+)
MSELKMMSGIQHDFIINVKRALQDKENLYLVMDYASGGNLEYHLDKKRRFSEVETRKYFLNGDLLWSTYIPKELSTPTSSPRVYFLIVQAMLNLATSQEPEFCRPRLNMLMTLEILSTKLPKFC